MSGYQSNKIAFRISKNTSESKYCLLKNNKIISLEMVDFDKEINEIQEKREKLDDKKQWHENSMKKSKNKKRNIRNQNHRPKNNETRKEKLQQLQVEMVELDKEINEIQEKREKLDDKEQWLENRRKNLKNKKRKRGNQNRRSKNNKTRKEKLTQLPVEISELDKEMNKIQEKREKLDDKEQWLENKMKNLKNKHRKTKESSTQPKKPETNNEQLQQKQLKISELEKEIQILREKNESLISFKKNSEEKINKKERIIQQLDDQVEKLKQKSRSQDSEIQLNISQRGEPNKNNAIIQKDLVRSFKNSRAIICNKIKRIITEIQEQNSKISKRIIDFYNYNMNIFEEKWLSYLNSLNYSDLPKIRQFGFLQQNFLQWYMEIENEYYLKREIKEKYILDFLKKMDIVPIKQIYSEMEKLYGVGYLSKYLDPKSDDIDKSKCWERALKAIETDLSEIVDNYLENHTKKKESLEQIKSFIESQKQNTEKYFIWFELFQKLYDIFWVSFGIRNQSISFEHTKQLFKLQRVKIIQGEFMKFEAKPQKFNPDYHKSLFRKKKFEKNEDVVVCVPLIFFPFNDTIIYKARVIHYQNQF
ncbi:hypothetical protein M0813_10204 [Anaeramoeba flamelloides]|uniref:Uncharacterized protein n=1 Tax=Anaeramoeba flamelloides TaxID=1746091 RepID=A0ABQ8X334_9EUKA|nr:hypothetical protein M0813_10204 [Anaeramoeba flamelloides]